MAVLLTGDKPKPTRFRLVEVVPRGAAGGGKETNLGSGGDVPLIVRVPGATQSVPSLSVRTQPVGSAPTDIFDIDQNGQISVLGGIAGGFYCAQVALSAANIIAMNGAPVQILAAPGANKLILVDMIHFQFKAATQFTGGGAVTFVYHGGSVNPHGSNIPAATITSASSSNNVLPPQSAVIQPPTNTGIDITNATAAFATGTGTAIVTIWYSILTLG
jgi:hypothetical protein